MNKSSKFIAKCREYQIRESSKTINIDDLEIKDIQMALIHEVSKVYPNLKDKFKVLSDGNEMRVELPGQDRCYGTLDLNTGKIDVLGD